VKQRPRIYYSDRQKALIWQRGTEGWTLQEIGIRSTHSSIQGIFAQTRFIRPRAEPFTACTHPCRRE
jgi:hypothetical protein